MGRGAASDRVPIARPGRLRMSNLISRREFMREHAPPGRAFGSENHR